ncbi:MAG: hypothetical protein AB1345_08695 [Chloroflexota bacterium]
MRTSLVNLIAIMTLLTACRPTVLLGMTPTLISPPATLTPTPTPFPSPTLEPTITPEPSLTPTPEPVDPTKLTDEELVAFAPDLTAEGLTKVPEVAYGLENQRYVKYTDAEGLVRRVFDTESQEVLFAGESVWNAQEKTSGETVKFSCLVVTSKGTEENDGHFEINQDKLEECARTVAAVAAVNHGKNVVPGYNPSPEAKEKLVRDLIDRLLADIVSARQKGEELHVYMGGNYVDPTKEIIIQLNYDPEAKGKGMSMWSGYNTEIKRLVYSETEDRLVILLKNAAFGEHIQYYSENYGLIKGYAPHGWLYEGLIRMLKNPRHSGMTGENDKFLHAPNSLYYAILAFANNYVRDYDGLPDSITVDTNTSNSNPWAVEISADEGDWFGGDFVVKK